MQLGKHECRLLLFAIRYAGWHTYGTDITTVKAVRSLVAKGFLEVNENRQFKLASK